MWAIDRIYNFKCCKISKHFVWCWKLPYAVLIFNYLCINIYLYYHNFHLNKSKQKSFNKYPSKNKSVTKLNYIWSKDINVFPLGKVWNFATSLYINGMFFIQIIFTTKNIKLSQTKVHDAKAKPKKKTKMSNNGKLFWNCLILIKKNNMKIYIICIRFIGCTSAQKIFISGIVNFSVVSLPIVSLK